VQNASTRTSSSKSSTSIGGGGGGAAANGCAARGKGAKVYKQTLTDVLYYVAFLLASGCVQGALVTAKKTAGESTLVLLLQLLVFATTDGQL
jgi:hypothetical protein